MKFQGVRYTDGLFISKDELMIVRFYQIYTKRFCLPYNVINFCEE